VAAYDGAFITAHRCCAMAPCPSREISFKIAVQQFDRHKTGQQLHSQCSLRIFSRQPWPFGFQQSILQIETIEWMRYQLPNSFGSEERLLPTGLLAGSSGGHSAGTAVSLYSCSRAIILATVSGCDSARLHSSAADTAEAAAAAAAAAAGGSSMRSAYVHSKPGNLRW
jgi:hypothetical protein